MVNLFAALLLVTTAWTAKWIGPAPETRPDRDFGDAQWISAPSDNNGVVTLKTAFDYPLSKSDAVVEFVHVSDVEHEVTVNGHQCYRCEGHVKDFRYPIAQNIAHLLKPGLNEVTIRLKGNGGMLLAGFFGEYAAVTDSRWTSPDGKVREFGTARSTPFGKTLILRTEKFSPAFAKSFAIGSGLRSATLRIAGIGFYEASINGAKIGDAVLEPTPSAYDHRVLYRAYDLSSALHEGENELLVLLGHGWYDNRSIATWNFDVAPWRDFPRVIAQLDVIYADGRKETVATDSSWRQVANPVVYDDIYEGEIVDARIVAGEPLPCGPLRAVEVPGPGGRLEPAKHPYARVVERTPAASVRSLGDGEYLVEFPHNVVGWMRLEMEGQHPGDIVSFRYDERPYPQDRMIDVHFRHTASYPFCAQDASFQCDRYMCRGGVKEIYEPRFSYKGFRYVYVRGLRQQPKLEAAQACFVQTDFPTVGSFLCSDDTFTRLMEMGVRTYRCNFTDGVPTDCPHREKNGWTGDASIACELAQYVFDNTAAYENWLINMIDAQLPSGDVPCIVPSSGWGFAWGNGPAWDSALPVVAWTLWNYRDDRKILDTAYPAIRKYLAFTSAKADAQGLVSHGLGDWSPVNRDHMPSVEFTSSCYYYQALRIAAEIASIKGFVEDATKFAAAAEMTLGGLRSKYRKTNGVWDNGGQTAQAMALAFGLVAEDELTAVEAKLVESVVRTDTHVDMGLLGMKHVFRALSRAGRTDLAWRMLTNPTSPSPVDWIRKGGTTLWEDWEDGLSRNHIMFGDFVGWAYQYLAGIQLPEAPGSSSAIMKTTDRGFRKVVFAPCVIEAVNQVSASVRTPYGIYESSWARESGRVTYRFVVPPGGSAVIHLAGRKDESVGAGTYTR